MRLRAVGGEWERDAEELVVVGAEEEGWDEAAR